MRPAEFIASCRAVGRLEFSEPVVQPLFQAVTVEFPQYAPPDRPRQGTYLLSDASAYGSSRQLRADAEELVQHLTDLAYLPLRFRTEWLTLEDRPTADQLGKLLQAATAFFTEDPYFSAVGVQPPPATNREARLAWLTDMLAVLTYRAGLYTSYDGWSEELPARYRVGERSALGRSLAFRLRVYLRDYQSGRGGGQRVAYFDERMLPQLYAVDNAVGGAMTTLLPSRGAKTLSPGLIQLLFDDRALLRYFRRAHRFSPGVKRTRYLVYRRAQTGRLDALNPEEAGRQLTRLRRRVGRRLVQGEVLADTGSNRLGIRLLQLGLWRAGFYLGALDGRFGPQSHAAVLALVEQEREQKQPAVGPRQLDRLLVEVGDLIAVDLKLLSKVLTVYAPVIDAGGEEALWQQLSRNVHSDELDQGYRKHSPAVQQLVQQRVRRAQRRRYYGLGGLLRGAVRAVGRLLRWIAGMVTELVGAVVNFVQLVAKRFREGVSLFAAGLRYFGHYLLGRPIITLGQGRGKVDRPLISTRYALDFDVVAMVASQSSLQDMRAHTEYLRHLQHGASFFLDVAARLFRGVGLLTSPTGWVQLGAYLGRLARDLWRNLRTGGLPGRLEQLQQIA